MLPCNFYKLQVSPRHLLGIRYNIRLFGIVKIKKHHVCVCREAYSRAEDKFVVVFSSSCFFLSFEDQAQVDSLRQVLLPAGPLVARGTLFFNVGKYLMLVVIALNFPSEHCLGCIPESWHSVFLFYLSQTKNFNFPFIFLALGNFVCLVFILGTIFGSHKLGSF